MFIDVDDIGAGQRFDQGRLVGDELRLTLLTVGASTAHEPVTIVPRSAAVAAAR